MPLFEYEGVIIYISPCHTVYGKKERKRCYKSYHDFHKAEHNKTQYKNDWMRKQVTMSEP